MQMDPTRAKLCFIACLIVVKFKGKIRPQPTICFQASKYVKRRDEKSTVALKIRHDRA